MPRTERIAIGVLLLAILFWGAGFPLTRAQTLLLQQDLGRPFAVWDSALLISLRFGLAALVLWPVVPTARKRPTRPEWEQGLALGAVLGIGISIHTFGISQVPASTAAFLTQFYVVLVPIYIAIGTRRLPNARTLGAAALALIGIAILAEVDRVGLRLDLGAGVILAAAFLFAVQILLMNVNRYRSNRAGTYTFVMCAAISLCFVWMWPSPHGAEFLHASLGSGPAIGITLLQMLITVVIPFLMMNAYQRFVSPVRASLIYASEPIPAGLSAAFLPGLASLWLGIQYANEPLTLRLAIGGALLLAANFLIATERSPEAAE